MPKCACMLCPCLNSCYDILVTICDKCDKEILASEKRAADYDMCQCKYKREDCSWCRQHRGTNFRFEKCVIKQEFLGFDGRFAKHDPYDMFGYELNMYSQRILKELI